MVLFILAFLKPFKMAVSIDLVSMLPDLISIVLDLDSVSCLNDLETLLNTSELGRDILRWKSSMEGVMISSFLTQVGVVRLGETSTLPSAPILTSLLRSPQVAGPS